MIGKRLVYSAGVALYLAGWAVTAGGLGAIQHWCQDSSSADVSVFTGGLLANVRGDDCEKLFRFPWFIWALSALPVLLSIGAMVSPSMFRGATTALFAVLAPLHVLLANVFNNIRDTDTFTGKAEDRAQVTLAGFAVMAGASLLLIVLHSLLIEGKEEETGGKVHKHTTDDRSANV